MTLLFPKHKSHRRFCWRWLRSCIRYCSIRDNLAVVRRPDNTFDERAECRLQSTEQSKHCRQCGFRGSECLRRSRRCSQTPAICHRPCRGACESLDVGSPSSIEASLLDAHTAAAASAYRASYVLLSPGSRPVMPRKCLLASCRLIQRRCQGKVDHPDSPLGVPHRR